jgi:hypothetical protein
MVKRALRLFLSLAILIPVAGCDFEDVLSIIVDPIDNGGSHCDKWYDFVDPGCW